MKKEVIKSVQGMQDDDTRKSELRGLQEASAATACTNLLLITHDEENQLLLDNKQVSVIPAWKWINSPR